MRAQAAPRDARFASLQLRRVKRMCRLILPWNLKRETMREMAGVRDWGGQFVTPAPEIAVHS